MNMCSKSWNITGASPHISSWSIQHTVLPPIKAMLYQHTYTVLLPIYRIWIAMKYHFKVDNYALAYIIAPVNGFGSANGYCYSYSWNFLLWFSGLSWGILLLLCRYCWCSMLNNARILHLNPFKSHFPFKKR